MTGSQTDPSSGEILIVDDTPDNLRFLSLMLTQRGYEVRKALNGPMALASAQAELPDLILLDIRMLEMDGYEVCRTLKADPQTSEVPVIFISALDDVLDKVKAFGVGGVDYITKPFQSAEVLARVEHQLNLRQLQKRLVAQNEELARSNRELEQFAYMVSHDLQQPLQSITGFARFLHVKYENDLDAKAIQYINQIIDAGSRMQNLIQDLLAYSQSGKVQEFQAIDCNQVLEQVLDNLQAAIAEKLVSITADSLPVVMASEIQLVQLFQNLLSNASKFVRADVTPQVRISVTPVDNQWQFAIQDNGIGIAAEHLHQIFEVFQRLHSIKEYPGNGIGLATCKRIVELHGGRIWVESKLHEGTTFYFTLAKIPQANPISGN
jgi:signal transduction histidine kinase